MSAQHTPGPWDVGSKHEHGTEVKGVFGVGVAWCGCNAFYGSGGSHVITEDEAYANACLIAAAPDLLAALGVILRDYTAVYGEGDLEMQPAIYQASTAISKATGSEA